MSAAVKFGSSEVIWNERASPSWLRFQAGRCVTSCPAKRMVPALGRNWPINWLISVVLPAPFGPMIACNSPLRDIERKIVGGDDAAEAPDQIFDAQQGFSHGKTSRSDR